MIRRSNSCDAIKTPTRSCSLNSLKTPPTSPKPSRGILRKAIIDNKSKIETMKTKKEPRIVLKSKEVKPKKEPVIEWSAMEWNGKNEVEELHQKIKMLNDRIESFTKNGTEDNDTNYSISTSEWNKIQPRLTSALEKRLDKLEEDIHYLDSSL